jgi:hypothetical protein
VHLWPCTDAEIAKNTGCYINVTEVDKLYAEYKAHGILHPSGELQVMPWEMKQFTIVIIMATLSILERM